MVWSKWVFTHSEKNKEKEEKMIYINNRNKNIYNKRPGAYAIIENDKNEIAIVRDGDNDLFYFGGGLEKG